MSEEGIEMKKVMLVLVIFLSVLFLNPQLVIAQDLQYYASKSTYSKSGLEVSDYKKVNLSFIAEGIDKINLKEERIKRTCELHLRQAGLEPIPFTSASEVLFVRVNVVGMAFDVRLQYYRSVFFPVDNKLYSNFANTWERKFLGTHGLDSELIFRALDELLDDFLNEYLKANVK